MRNIFDPPGIWHGGTQTNVQFHQKMRANSDVEAFRKMRDFKPWRDAADASDVHLNDGAGASLQVVAKMNSLIKSGDIAMQRSTPGVEAY